MNEKRSHLDIRGAQIDRLSSIDESAPCTRGTNPNVSRSAQDTAQCLLVNAGMHVFAVCSCGLRSRAQVNDAGRCDKRSILVQALKLLTVIFLLDMSECTICVQDVVGRVQLNCPVIVDARDAQG